MVKTNKKKVCIVASSLSKGGAERSSAILSQMLFNLGFEVYIVTVLDGVDYEFSGELLNLGTLKNTNDSFLGRFKRLQVFKSYISKNDFDLIIDNRSRVQAYREFIVSTFIYNKPTIYVIHNFNSKKTFTKYKWLNTLLYKNEYMTAVSKAACKKFKNKFNLSKIRTIYNGFNFKTIQELGNKKIVDPLPLDYIIFFGRIDNQHKNLKLLLEAYKSSNLSKQGVKLLILGDGPDLSLIKDYALSLHISEDIYFKGFVNNPYPYVKKAKFTVLTSRFEGFPMVIPESLSLGVPVVSVDCDSGPNEVITTGFNGILVENHNANKLATAFNKMVLDDEFYNICVSNAVKSVQDYSLENVQKSWANLLNEILE